MNHSKIHHIAAIAQKGNMISIEDVTASGEECRCRCSTCNGVLLAINPNGEGKQSPHFRHKSDGDCRGGGEGDLHKMAKEAIERELKLLTPKISRAGMQAFPQLMQSLTSAAAEEKVYVDDRYFKPDVTIETTAGDTILVEIKITSGVGDRKLKQIERNGIPALEIILDPTADMYWSKETLRRLVIGEGFDPAAILNRRWLYHPAQAQTRSIAQESPRLTTVPVKEHPRIEPDQSQSDKERVPLRPLPSRKEEVRKRGRSKVKFYTPPATQDLASIYVPDDPHLPTTCPDWLLETMYANRRGLSLDRVIEIEKSVYGCIRGKESRRPSK